MLSATVAAVNDGATQLRQTLREQHERMLAAMTTDERRGLLTGLGALVRELATFHPENKTGQNSTAT